MGTSPCTTCGEVHPGCAAHTRNGPNAGRPCQKAPIIGAKVCTSHGGRARQVRAAAARAVEEQAAARAVQTLGLPVDISPTDALLEEVRWTAGHVQWLRSKVAELDAEPTHTAETLDGEPAGYANRSGRGMLTWGVTKVKTGGDDRGETQEAAPSIWYVLYAKERQHLVTVCQAAIKAGVEERRVRLAEGQGELVSVALSRILDGLLQALVAAGLAAHLREVWEQQVPVIVPRELRSLAEGRAA